MSKFMDERWSWIEGSNGLRSALLDTLTDADLAYTPGGRTPTLGALLRETGEIEYAYLQSFKTFNTDFAYRNTEPGLERSLSAIKAWYDAMDADLKATLVALSDDDLKKTVTRSSGGTMPLEMQLEVYLQCLFIFFGKATVYWRTMNKDLPPLIEQYIG